MKQFDVFPNPAEELAEVYPFVVVLQHNHHIDLRSVVIAPLALPGQVQPISRMMPLVEVNGERLLLSVQDLATLNKHYLSKPVTNLSQHRDAIISALDLLFTGV